MGEFTSGENISTELSAQRVDTGVDIPDGFETDVEGIKANGQKDGVPIFDVPKDHFYNNMKADRKRLRFDSEAPVSQYLRNTKYKKPFYISTTDDNGQKFLRKVK